MTQHRACGAHFRPAARRSDRQQAERGAGTAGPPPPAAAMNGKGQYPTQPSYPVQSAANPPVYPQTVPLPQPPPYTDAPPAYSELYRPSFVPLGAATVPTMSAAYPGASVFLPVAQSVAVGPIGSSVPMAYYPVGPVYPPGSTVLVEGGFDAGARFGAGGTASIPPPPPGCPPNAAQLAVMQGANVLVTQRKGNFFLGGSDGGYTIW
ncbi:DAZ-associated protein 2 isoform X2 [Gallus gallus]|nr:DAZ-associated protein 2 isoform X1 [Gallus gallus]XP_040549763.1 DAZ-associated protein 2 isoform X2 [Gallus gallus]|eukprot:XP_025001426.1 DAZ-associated protein 2 [Gallus gallus]